MSYDSWKLDYTDRSESGNFCSHCGSVTDTDDPLETACSCISDCESCGASLSEMTIKEAVGLCEDCLCTSDGENEDSCEGCFYCLSCKEYDERKADGTLKTE